MKSSKRVWEILLVSAVMLFLGFAGLKLRSHEIVRCYLVRWSDLEKIAPNLYVAPDMPESKRQMLLSLLSDAKKRVGNLYGEFTADPVIIAGHTMEVMTTFGGNSYNRAGRTSITPITSFIILGPEGIQSLDVLSHEMAHAEFSERIGYWNRNSIPNWFDEGLALQFDDRYSETEWQTWTDDGRLGLDLDQIGIITHDNRLGYLTAKHEVQRWLDSVDQEDLLKLIQSIRSGSEFRETYSALEEEAVTTQQP